jgi:hypothetical protein
MSTSSVWAIYYNHWGRESQQKKRELFRRKSATQTIGLIREKCRYNTDPLTQHRFLYSIINQKTSEQRIKCLKELAHILFPIQTPLDYEFLPFGFNRLIWIDDRLDTRDPRPYSPGELRLKRNCRNAQFRKISAKRAHVLDSILVLF